MALPVAVQGAEHSLALDHLLQSSLRVMDLAGGVVQNHDQAVTNVRPETTDDTVAVDVQQHSG